MDGWAYLREICCRSLRWARGIEHGVHFLLLCLGGLMIWCSVHFEHYALAVMLPLGVAIAFFLSGVVRETFALYCEECARSQELHEALVREREQRAASVRDTKLSAGSNRTQIHTHKR